MSRTAGQPGLVRTQRREAADHDDARDRRDRLAAPGAVPLRRLPRRAAVHRDGVRAHAPDAPSATGGSRAGSRGSVQDGRLAALLIQRVWIWPSSPEERSSSIACETQPVSGESLPSRAPHWSPPGALNWPTIVAFGTCAAVR